MIKLKLNFYITAWDKKKKQFIPSEDFAISGDGKLLIAYDRQESIFLSPDNIEFAGYKESSEITIDDVEIQIEQV